VTGNAVTIQEVSILEHEMLVRMTMKTVLIALRRLNIVLEDDDEMQTEKVTLLTKGDNLHFKTLVEKH
jgi:hypothetical protein